MFFDRFNDPSAGSPRVLPPALLRSASSSGSGLVRPFILRLPLGRAGLYLKPTAEADSPLPPSL